MLRDNQRSTKYQIYILWFEPTGVQIYELSHSKKIYSECLFSVNYKNLNKLVEHHDHLMEMFGFYWWRKPEDPEKTIDLPQVTDKNFYHMMLYT
jgi:hypothetical protein